MTVTEELEKLTERIRRRAKEDDIQRRALASFPLEKLNGHTVHCNADYSFTIAAGSVDEIFHIAEVLPPSIAMNACGLEQRGGILHFAQEFENYKDWADGTPIAPIIAVIDGFDGRQYFQWFSEIECKLPTGLKEEYLDKPGFLRVRVQVVVNGLNIFGIGKSSEERDYRGNIVSITWGMLFDDNVEAQYREVRKYHRTTRVDKPSKMIACWTREDWNLQNILH